MSTRFARCCRCLATTRRRPSVDPAIVLLEEPAMVSTDPSVIEALRASPIGSALSPEQCGVLAALVDWQTCRRGDVVGEEGKVDDRLLVVVEGSLGVTKHVGTRAETLLATLHRGDLAHELGFLDGAPRYASLVAAEPSKVLVL